jgi:uncharacterized damage-inducible protein DinB
MTLDHYKYGGARALVLLHERHMRVFLNRWKEAKARSIALPATEDPSYASLEALLKHVFRAGRGYMTWMCEKLELPDPGIDREPAVEVIEAQADAYLDHLLEKWRAPLADVPEERFYNATYTSRWKVDYCIDAMMEHAVMHPVRHEFQLAALCAGE